MRSKRNNRQELRITNDALPGDGFTIIEVLITTFIIGTVVTGLFGLFVLNLRAAQEAERRVVAIALANERAEMIRNLPYLNVGTSGGVPAGTIPQEVEITRNGQPYTVRTDIRYIDDPFDGVAGDNGGASCVTVCHVPPDDPASPVTLCVDPAALDAHIAHGDTTGPCVGEEPLGDDLLNTDYKQVRIEVSWPSHNAIRPVLLLTFVAPPGIEGGELGGTLDFQALTAAGQGVEGATVRLVNSSVNPAIDITTLTNIEGRIVLPGMPDSADAYELTVSKAGYTSEQTYDQTASFVPDSDHSHLSILLQALTQKTFFIDLIARLDVATIQGNAKSYLVEAGDGIDYVAVPHVAGYASADGTVSLWFKANSASGKIAMLSKDSAGFDNGGQLTLRLNGANVRGILEDSTKAYTVSSNVVSSDTWYHVALSWGAGGLKLYLDGGTPVVNSYTGGTIGNQEPIAIGASTENSDDLLVTPVDNGFSGLIDDVRWFDRALLDSEVQTLAQDGVGVTDGLVSHWQLNDFSGSQALDAIAGNHGSFNGTIASSDDVPFNGGEYSVGGLAYTLRGTKTIGVDGFGATVYVLDATAQTDPDGANSHENLVWDSYELLIDGAATGFDIQESSLVLPLVINPADDLDLTLTLVPHTTVSLHVTVTDTNANPISEASVQLTDNGVDQTLTTGAAGQVLFSDLPVAGDYTLQTSATGWQTLNQSVTVAGTTLETVQLIAQ